jgi:hypothetical protein
MEPFQTPTDRIPVRARFSKHKSVVSQFKPQKYLSTKKLKEIAQDNYVHFILTDDDANLTVKYFD